MDQLLTGGIESFKTTVGSLYGAKEGAISITLTVIIAILGVLFLLYVRHNPADSFWKDVLYFFVYLFLFAFCIPILFISGLKDIL